jgi:pimeloyl-ACP methyl ester carboxylesterase
MLPGFATVLLVHGAWHSAGCWELVVAGLQSRGIPVATVDLPTCDESRDGAVPFSEDTAAVRKAIAAIEGPVLVVGHSYGGMVITEGAAHAENVQRLVYLAAYMPDAGEPFSALATLTPDRAVLKALRRDERGRSYVDPAQMHELFYGDCDDAKYARASTHLRTMSMNVDATTKAQAWQQAPSTYVVAAQDRAIPPRDQRTMSARATEVIEWQTSHSPFTSQPELVVNLLAELAATASANA